MVPGSGDDWTQISDYLTEATMETTPPTAATAASAASRSPTDKTKSRADSTRTGSTVGTNVSSIGPSYSAPVAVVQPALALPALYPAAAPAVHPGA